MPGLHPCVSLRRYPPGRRCAIVGPLNHTDQLPNRKPELIPASENRKPELIPASENRKPELIPASENRKPELIPASENRKPELIPAYDAALKVRAFSSAVPQEAARWRRARHEHLL